MGDWPASRLYSTRTYEVTTQGIGEVGAFLNGDDTNGEGPEVIELNTRTPGEVTITPLNHRSNTAPTLTNPTPGLKL